MCSGSIPFSQPSRQLALTGYEDPCRYMSSSSSMGGTSRLRSGTGKSSYPVRANWRLGCENGIDPLHIYIHRESRLVPNTQRSIPLGHRVNLDGSDNRVLEEEEGKPKGVRSAEFREGQASAYVP